MSKRIETPILLQTDAAESGAAALGIVLRYYGSHVPLEELRYACGVGSDGSRARNVVKAARDYGLDAEGLRRGDANELRKLPLPQILLWDRSQFVVLERVGRRTVAINDPASGRRTVSQQEFEASYDGVTLVMQPGDGFRRIGQRFDAGRTLRERMSGTRGAVIFLLLASLFLVIPGVVVPTLLRVFVDDILSDGQNWLPPLLVGMGVAALVSGLLAWLQRMTLLRMEIAAGTRGSSRFMWHLLRLPIAFFDQRSGGDIAARVELNDRTARLLSGDLALAALGVVTLPVYALVMLQYSAILTVIGILFAVFNLFVLYYLSRRRRDVARLALHERRSLISDITDGLCAVETYIATGAEGALLARWTSTHERLSALERQLGYSNYLLTAISLFLFAMNAAIVLMAGGGMMLQGTLTVGMFAAFQSLMISFCLPISQLLRLASRWQEAESTLEITDDLLANPTDPALDEADEPGVLSGQLEVRNLSFGYNLAQPPVVQDFSVTIQPGERVALVGAPGSGKTTVARLIAGLYTPWSGDVLLDGQARASIPRSVVNRAVALVDQESAFFSGTVQENLTLWDEYAPLTDLWRAARDADIHEKILHRPGGYDHMMGERGRNFSACERQRLGIARALVNNPTLLILDEATNALDPLSEARLIENLGWRGCSYLIVSQRLSAIRDCDAILVMDGGRVVEQGTHDALVALGGMYAQMLEAETHAGESPQSRLTPAWLQASESDSTEATSARSDEFANRGARPLPNATLGVLGLLRFGLGTSRGLLILLIVVGLVGGLLATALPLLTAAVIDSALPSGDRQLLQVAGLTLALTALGTALFQLLRGALAVRLQSRIERQLEPALWERLLSLRVSFFRVFTTGDLADRALGVSQIKSALADATATSPLAMVFALASLALMFYFDAAIALVSVVIVTGALAVTYVLGGFGRTLARVHTELHGETAGLIFQFLKALPTLRVAGAEFRAFGVWAQLVEWRQRQTFKARRAQSLAHLFLAAYPILAAMGLFALTYARRTMTLGEFVGFNLAFSQLNLAAVQFGKTLIALRHAEPHAARLQPILLAAPETSAGEATDALAGAISVSHLSFGYADDRPTVLSDVSFRIEPGEFVAIVGASGSGKSTLLRLMIGFEQPLGGEIAYDEMPLARWNTRALRRQIGVVLEDTQPLAGSVLSNIGGGHDLSTDDAWRAARLAGLADDIRALPMGMQTLIGENGGPLSSGQRQRLLLARALAARPRILLLDEITGGLDNTTHAQIMQSLRRMSATRVVVAHRLTTAAAADRILVLRDGRIVESGTYASLMRSGQFSALAQAQLR